jgi:hypothetical protein
LPKIIEKKLKGKERKLLSLLLKILKRLLRKLKE